MLAMVIAFMLAVDVRRTPRMYRVHRRDIVRARLGAGLAAGGLLVIVIFQGYGLIAPAHLRWW